MKWDATSQTSLVADLWLLVERRRYYKRDKTGAEQARRNARAAQEAADFARTIHLRNYIGDERMREIYQ